MNNKIRLTLFILLIATFSYFSIFTSIQDYLTVEYIRNFIKDVPTNYLSILSLLAFFTIGGISFISLPLMVITTSLLFGWKASLIISSTGVILGSSAGYMLGRYFIPYSKTSRRIETIKDKIKEKGLIAIILLRVSPLPPFTMTSFCLGALKINLSKYILGTLLGVMPITLISIFMGRYVIDNVLSRSHIPLRTIAISILIILMLFFIKNFLKRKKLLYNNK